MKRNSINKLTMEAFSSYLAPRQRNANKANFGHVLVIGGDYGYSGAVRMAGEAALRVGAGLVTIATRPEHAFVLNASRPELMCHGVNNAKEVEPLFDKATVVVIGPGMGKSAWGQKLLYLTLKTNKPLILVDADGLNLLAEKPARKDNWILTPHPGEAARLLKTQTETIQNDRVAAALQLQEKFGGVSVLKGAGTLIVGPNKEVSICEAGNPGMASAGMGDILSGVIGGLLAQGLPSLAGAQLGVLIHALAGDRASEQGGERGMIATDLLSYLRSLVNIGIQV